MPSGVHVLVWHRADGGDALRQAFRASEELLAGTPGLLGMSLSRCVARPDRYVLTMTWEELAAFERWEGEAGHRGYGSPLRPFQDRQRPGGHYEVMETVDVDAPR
jgi:hypothetical protein